MGTEVTLVGIDVGTTTTSAVFARATLARDHRTGRVTLRDVRESYRSEIVFTPFTGEILDEARIAAHLDAWLAAAGASGVEIFGGGAIITGLAARRANAASLARLVRARLHDAVIAAADDPGLESWLAFMGSAAALSRAQPETPILNLDIGGGTTNLAIGLGGEVRATGALFVGARHVQVEPGSYRIVRMSEQARELFEHLGIARIPGKVLTEGEVGAVMDFQIGLLEAAVTGREEAFREPMARGHVQAAMRIPPELGAPALTFSGGVGEICYARLRGAPLLPVTPYGDLGADLAERILGSPVLSARVLVPESAGRATSYGLLYYSTQISGATLFLPKPEVLPLVDLPILGRISEASTPAQIEEAVALVRRSPVGGCLTVRFAALDARTLREVGQGLGRALEASQFPADHPLVLLLPQNAGKALGGYVTGWGRLPIDLVVVDEIQIDPSAHFVQIGRLRDQIIPVSFHGMAPREDAP